VPTSPPGPGLPQTGADPGPAVALALMMISFGSLLVIGVRRRLFQQP
jgi:LPXTG-motif cell wall-anchored protein